MYYRFTNSKNPMSDWGHAMMCDTEDSVRMYGEDEYIYDGSNATRIEDLKDEIIAKWNECLENEFFGYDVPCSAEEWFKTLSAEEVYNSMNPSDIVMGAEGYDCELVFWFWENVLEPKEIYAVLTEDGAVVFDEELLQKVEIDDQLNPKGGFTMVKNKNGALVAFDAAVRLMDDEIREKLHFDLAPCTDQEFFTAYEKAHEEKYGEEWELSKENPVW